MDYPSSQVLERIVGKCTFTLFNQDGYVIAVYEKRSEKRGKKKETFTAKGKGLPTLKNVYVEMEGSWLNDPRGPVFAVQSFELVRPESKDGLTAYFSSMKVGIGKASVEKIYDVFGEKIWDVIDNDPEQLYTVPGIPKDRLKELLKRLKNTEKLRDVIKTLKGFEGLTLAKAQKIADYLGDKPVSVLRENPYIICEISGFPFDVVDEAAKNLPDYSPSNPARLAAAINAALFSFQSHGNTCVPKDMLLQSVGKIAGLDDTEVLRAALNTAFSKKKLHVTGGYCFSRASFIAERTIAAHAVRLVREKPVFSVTDDELFSHLSAFEEENGVVLAEEQKTAIRAVFGSNLSIITGGSGTGKSTIIKAVLYVANIINPDLNPGLMAPTGRAARRMSDASGYAASTVHSGLGISYGDDSGIGNMVTEEPLENDIVIVDEVSMLDQSMALCLLSRISSKTVLVLVGDADQLPSVGCGKVLADMINSGKIPTTRLSTIFRQQEGDAIILNSQKINSGQTDLISTNNFCFYCDQGDPDYVFEQTVMLYKACAKKFKPDDILLLVPYRQKGRICADTLNERIEKELNPQDSKALTMKSHGKVFRVGDRVMQTRNTDLAKNGDIGVIRAIRDEWSKDNIGDKRRVVEIMFEGNMLAAYTDKDMLNVDLAYAMSVHKAQGNEAAVVIVVMTEEHSFMARRNLLYTAVTRAKKNIALLGDSSAFVKAINNRYEEPRYTCLKEFICWYAENVPEGVDPLYYNP